MIGCVCTEHELCGLHYQVARKMLEHEVTQRVNEHLKMEREKTMNINPIDFRGR